VALPDGDVVLVGGSIAANSTFYAAELRPDGSLDPSFGTGGLEHVPLRLSAVGVLFEPDGKLLVLATGPALSKLQGPQLMVVRLNANGTLDQTYGVDGVAHTGLWGSGAGAISADGELLVSGTTGPESTEPPPALSNLHWVIEELTSTGTLDPAFGLNGALTIAVKHASGDQLAVEPDGDIVADGVPETDYPMGGEYLTRLTPQGAEDPTFAAGRPVVVADSGGVAGMLVQPDGSITLLDGLGLERYTPDGTLDEAFGSHGVALVPALVAGDGGDQLLPGPGSDVLVASYPGRRTGRSTRRCTSRSAAGPPATTARRSQQAPRRSRTASRSAVSRCFSAPTAPTWSSGPSGSSSPPAPTARLTTTSKVTTSTTSPPPPSRRRSHPTPPSAPHPSRPR
jgi:uncharacterized delta-60 repeat protein